VATERLDHRDAAQRQHRIIGLYAALFSWAKGEEGCFIPRDFLEDLLGLQRFKAARVQWLIADLAVYFQYVESTVEEGTDDFSGVIVSRVTTDEMSSRGYTYRDLPRLDLPDRGDPEDQNILFSSKEHKLVGMLSLLCSGAIAPSDIPGLDLD
jgi:hypothetical protein